MTDSYTGGCACGAIRFETASEPIFQNHCQCRDCQKRSGTGHSSFLTFPSRADVKITGAATSWRVAGDSGNEKIHTFCPTCGSPVFLTFEAMPDLIAVHAASLDDPSRFEPKVVTYNARGLAWDARSIPHCRGSRKCRQVRPHSQVSHAIRHAMRQITMRRSHVGAWSSHFCKPVPN